MVIDQPTSRFTNSGHGNLASAPTGITSGTGSIEYIAGRESDNFIFVYESGRVLSMPTLGYMADATLLIGEFSQAHA